MLGVRVPATAVAGATAVAMGTAIPVAIDPTAAADTITRVIRDGLARIASSKGIGQGQEPAPGTRRPVDDTVALRVISERCFLMYLM